MLRVDPLDLKSDCEPRLPARRPAVRVLHVINGEHYSGAERVQDLLGLGLPQWGYDVVFACLKPGLFASQRQDQASPLWEVPMRGKFDTTVVRRLEDVIRQQGCRLLHAHTPRTLFVAARAARHLKLPLVYHVHSPVGRDSTRRWANWINAWSEQRSLRQASHLICVSDSLRRYMIDRGQPAGKLSVVLNGVPVRERVAQPVRPGQPANLGMVALFRPRKGVETLLTALSLLRGRGVAVRLTCVGAFESESYRAEVQQLADDLGVSDAVEWTGFERHVDRRLREMQALILPSLFGEGLPMVVLEAMAIGLPVVASRVEGVPEAIRDGQEGLIVEPNDPGDLAQKIERLISQPELWQWMQLNGWRRQREFLSADSMSHGVADVYQRLLS